MVIDTHSDLPHARQMMTMFGLSAAKDGAAAKRSSTEAAAMRSIRASPGAAARGRYGRSSNAFINSSSTVRPQRSHCGLVYGSLRELCVPLPTRGRMVRATEIGS